jgi:integrase
MARCGIERLKPAWVAKTKEEGLHADGGNLYLQVSVGSKGNTRKSWIFRFGMRGQHRQRDMGLGSLDTFGLGAARAMALEYRQLVAKGIDPIAHRDAARARKAAETAAIVTFDQAAETYVREHRAKWGNQRHAKQWTTTLEAYVSPILGKASVRDITTAHVLKVLNQPLDGEPGTFWTARPETASRVRGRIEAVLAWATVSEFRTGDNPARWKNHLDKLLPSLRKTAVKRQPALPYAEMPTLMAGLRERTGMSTLALQFALLTAVRSADVRHAKRADIDLAAKVWTIPKFSKTGKEHRVPLSVAALAVLRKAAEIADGIGGRGGASGLAFPNDVSGKPLSGSALLRVLELMGLKGAMTTHGARSAFRTWAMEQTNFPRELAEISLGHTVGTAVEQAYLRGSALQKRRRIMEAWSDYCCTPRPAAAAGVPLQGRTA